MPRPLPHDDTLRDRLVELASRTVAEHGSRGLSLRTVAAEAGTTTAAIYTLFGGRDGLVRAVVDEGFRRFAQHLDTVPRSADPRADLLALGVAYRDNALANPHFYRVMFGPGSGRDPAGDVPPAVRPTFAVLRDAVARLPHVTDAEELALRLWALVHGMVSLELAGLLPGSTEDHGRRYVQALRASRLSPG
ncbi:TetR/AcrR family transcriptional regulator [Georgenia sp. H159]|uniref:TetR/AcrR family transcriptional regulator n=1 Tax=Georgenia sp. H159 TaxID=3076115 RepID=UPI002D7982E8|nr:TetR/AcrR family transcriptional regulator [Georgenia sp. H159]